MGNYNRRSNNDNAADSTTDRLDKQLISTRPEGFPDYLENNSAHLVGSEKAFASYMRKLFRTRNLRQQDIFMKADIPERYGYKLISEEKRTRQRDYILRICLAAGFSLHEAQTALRLYGMSPLYPRIPRDAALIIAFNTGMSDPDDANRLLAENGLEELRRCSG